MNVFEFRNKWAARAPIVNERQSAQEHFRDLCDVFGAPTPNATNSADYCYEKAVGKLTGGRGFADVWRRGYWAWEYKRPGEDLAKAYRVISRARFPCPPIPHGAHAARSSCLLAAFPRPSR